LLSLLGLRVFLACLGLCAGVEADVGLAVGTDEELVHVVAVAVAHLGDSAEFEARKGYFDQVCLLALLRLLLPVILALHRLLGHQVLLEDLLEVVVVLGEVEVATSLLGDDLEDVDGGAEGDDRAPDLRLLEALDRLEDVVRVAVGDAGVDDEDLLVGVVRH